MPDPAIRRIGRVALPDAPPLRVTYGYDMLLDQLATYSRIRDALTATTTRAGQAKPNTLAFIDAKIAEIIQELD